MWRRCVSLRESRALAPHADMDSAQPVKQANAYTVWDVFPFSRITLCCFIWPTMHFYSATSALKMPVEFLTKGCTLCILLTLLLRLLNLEKVGVRSVRTSDRWCQTIIDVIINMIYEAVMNDEDEEQTNVFKLVKMYRLSSTSCKYWLRYSTQSRLLVQRVVQISMTVRSSNSESASLIHWSCTHLEIKSNLLQKKKKNKETKP